jgi:hypothetical protein
MMGFRNPRYVDRLFDLANTDACFECTGPEEAFHAHNEAVAPSETFEALQARTRSGWMAGHGAGRAGTVVSGLSSAGLEPTR